MNQKDIAVRMFMNAKYGTTYAKGKYKKALLNATAELRNPSLKYLLDFYNHSDWVNTAKTDLEMIAVQSIDNPELINNPQIMLSFVQHYDPLTKSKTQVVGVGILDLSSNTLKLVIDDVDNKIDEFWLLDVATCKAAGPGKPTYLAANIDVGNW